MHVPLCSSTLCRPAAEKAVREKQQVNGRRAHASPEETRGPLYTGVLSKRKLGKVRPRTSFARRQCRSCHKRKKKKNERRKQLRVGSRDSWQHTTKSKRSDTRRSLRKHDQSAFLHSFVLLSSCTAVAMRVRASSTTESSHIPCTRRKKKVPPCLTASHGHRVRDLRIRRFLPTQTIPLQPST